MKKSGMRKEAITPAEYRAFQKTYNSLFGKRYCDFTPALQLLGSSEQLAEIKTRFDQAGGQNASSFVLVAPRQCSSFGRFFI